MSAHSIASSPRPLDASIEPEADDPRAPATNETSQPDPSHPGLDQPAAHGGDAPGADPSGSPDDQELRESILKEFRSWDQGPDLQLDARLSTPQPAAPPANTGAPRADGEGKLQRVFDLAVASNNPGVDGGSEVPFSLANAGASIAKAHNSSQVPGAASQTLGTIPGVLSGLGDAADLVSQAKRLPGVWRERMGQDSSAAERRAAGDRLKSGAYQAGTDVTDLGQQTTGIASSLAQNAGAAAHLAQAAPILGAVVSGAVAGRATYRSSEAFSRRHELEATLREIPAGAEHDSVRNAAQYAADQMGKRGRRQRIGAAGAVVSTAGAGLAAAGAFGAGIGAVPGAAVAAAGASVSAGLTGYKALHYVQKKRGGTRGQERMEHAGNLWNAMNRTGEDSNGGQSVKAHAEKVVRNLGLDPEHLGRDEQRGRAEIAEALKSW